MSLLMEALRKAEEAKRKAAQQGQPNESEDTSEANAPEVLTAVEQEALLDESETLPLQSPVPAKGLDDIAFDFHIDENFEQEASPGADSPGVTETAVAHKRDEEIPSEPTALDDAHSVEFDLEATATPEVENSQEAEPDGQAETIEWQLDPAPDNEPVIASLLSLDDVESSSDVDGADEEDDDGAEYLKASDLARLKPAGKSALSEPASGVGSASVQVNADAQPATQVSAPHTTDTIGSAHKPDAAEADRIEALAQKKSVESRKRDSVRAVFDAKRARPGSNRGKPYAIAAAILLVPLAGGAYWIMDQMGLFDSGSQYNIPVANYDPNTAVWPDTAEIPDNAADNVSLSDLSDAPLEAADESLSAAEPVNAQDNGSAFLEDSMEIAVPEEQVATTDNAIESDANVAEIRNTEPPVQDALPGENPVVASDEEATSIRVMRAEVPAIDPSLTQAFNAYRENDFVTARAQYQQALRNSPNSRDALLGLAAVAMKTGDAVTARTHYSKLLELNPNDALARVGLLESLPSSDAVEKEGELRALFAEHPDVAPLAFALGNLLASQGRWSDAQQSYYDALLAAKAGGSGPVSPDYAFNLAVSLERLNQLRPAYNFYREALAQAEFSGPTFDIRILRDRLDALERVLP